MSLILDALRQAEHERGRDHAPDLFGPALGAAAPQPASPPTSRGPWALAAVAVLVAAGALAWAFWPRPPATARAPQAATPPVLAPQSTGAALFNPPLPAPVAAAPALPALAVAPSQTTPPAAAPSRPDPASPTTTAAVPSNSPPPPATGAAFETPPPAATELPADIRARLPGLNITGHTYSDNPTLRTLMIDGRMFVEGQAVQPGLRVERIGPHRAVFNHQGTRFAVDY
jgi:general secretion pathway protein B